ncbi:MAG: hypothetical protein AB1512_21300 [Thermodesulfobacteriota bacterium]
MPVEDPVLSGDQVRHDEIISRRLISTEDESAKKVKSHPRGIKSIDFGLHWQARLQGEAAQA